MDGMLNACGIGGMMQGPGQMAAIGAMAGAAGLGVLLWLVAVVLAVLGIVWLVRSLSRPGSPSGDAPARAGA
jgi:hypothetical protein